MKAQTYQMEQSSRGRVTPDGTKVSDASS